MKWNFLKYIYMLLLKPLNTCTWVSRYQSQILQVRIHNLSYWDRNNSSTTNIIRLQPLCSNWCGSVDKLYNYITKVTNTWKASVMSQKSACLRIYNGTYVHDWQRWKKMPSKPYIQNGLSQCYTAFLTVSIIQSFNWHLVDPYVQ